MSFSGCGKLMNIVGLNQPEIKPSNVSNKKLNQDNILTPTLVPLDSSSETNAKKNLTNEETWKEWACRQWNDNKWYWISGTVAVAVVATFVGVRYRYSAPPAPSPKLQLSEPTYYSYTSDVPQFPEELINKVMEEMAEAQRITAEVMEHAENEPAKEAARCRLLFLSHFSHLAIKNVRMEVFSSVLNGLSEEEIFFVEPE
jgi:hypothetical protein